MHGADNMPRAKPKRVVEREGQRFAFGFVWGFAFGAAQRGRPSLAREVQGVAQGLACIRPLLQPWVCRTTLGRPHCMDTMACDIRHGSEYPE